LAFSLSDIIKEKGNTFYSVKMMIIRLIPLINMNFGLKNNIVIATLIESVFNRWQLIGTAFENYLTYLERLSA